MFAMGLKLPGPPSAVNCVDWKLSNSSLTAGSLPGRCRSRVIVTGNFTPLSKFASSVSFLIRQRDQFWKRYRPPDKIRPFLFQIHTIRLVTATFLIAKRKTMNWTTRLTEPKLRALVRVCISSIYQRKRSRLFYEE